MYNNYKTSRICGEEKVKRTILKTGTISWEQNRSSEVQKCTRWSRPYHIRIQFFFLLLLSDPTTFLSNNLGAFVRRNFKPLWMPSQVFRYNLPIVIIPSEIPRGCYHSLLHSSPSILQLTYECYLQSFKSPPHSLASILVNVLQNAVNYPHTLLTFIYLP